MPDRVIVVTGPARVKAVTTPPATAGFRYVHWGWDLEGGSGGDTSGWDQSAAQEARALSEYTLQAQPTPCVQTSPIDTPLSSINNHAKGGGAILNDYRGTWEYSMIIYDSDGYLGKTPMFTSESRDHTTINLDSVPAGANVVGVIHNHLATPGVDQRYPSARDVEAYGKLVDIAMNGGRAFTVDPFMLFYIYDEATSKVFVYDKDSVRNGAASCYL